MRKGRRDAASDSCRSFIKAAAAVQEAPVAAAGHKSPDNVSRTKPKARQSNNCWGKLAAVV